ncbi:MAG: transglutaminase [Phycisphaerales bacterium]|nr:transglutaminase [Phycisphaerales bacterium]
MLIRVGYDIEFDLPAPAPMLTVLNLHPSRMPTVVKPEIMRVSPDVPLTHFYDSFGNFCGRLHAPAGRLRLTNEAVVTDTGRLDEYSPDAVQHKVEDLPDDALQFLLASRYCDVDVLSDTAWSLFGHTREGWSRVAAICDYVHDRLTFSYPNARSTRTASDAFNERSGVCRDFTHLAITFCRAMNVPARYATGYLGDLGVPYDPNPMDFSAWFEVYLSGRWWTFDARHNKRRIGRVLMARGRDAVDCALTTAFGTAYLRKFHVISDEVESY